MNNIQNYRNMFNQLTTSIRLDWIGQLHWPNGRSNTMYRNL